MAVTTLMSPLAHVVLLFWWCPWWSPHWCLFWHMWYCYSGYAHGGHHTDVSFGTCGPARWHKTDRPFYILSVLSTGLLVMLMPVITLMSSLPQMDQKDDTRMTDLLISSAFKRALTLAVTSWPCRETWGPHWTPRLEDLQHHIDCRPRWSESLHHCCLRRETAHSTCTVYVYIHTACLKISSHITLVKQYSEKCRIYSSSETHNQQKVRKLAVNAAQQGRYFFGAFRNHRGFKEMHNKRYIHICISNC